VHRGDPVLGAVGGQPQDLQRAEVAAMNASPVIQAGRERPERKKSSPVWTWRLAANPIPSTTAK
jgi:hypothetical protein